MDTMVPRKPKAGALSIRMIIMIVATVLVIGIVLAWQMLPMLWGTMLSLIGLGGGEQQGGGMGMMGPPPVVSTIKVRYEDWQPHIDVVGSLRAAQGADLAFEIPGVVQKIYFDSGRDVRAGTILISLRAADDVARLHTLQATAKLAETNYARALRLWKIKGISRQQVEEYAAALASARAQVAEAMANLNKKIMRAPFSGHLGLRNVNVGDYLNAGVSVVTLQALDPIYLDFTVPQQKLAQLRVGQSVSARLDAFPRQVFTGQITSIDPKADPTTRAVAVRATLPNHERRLVPGMFASAQINTGEPQRFLTLPQTAVTFNPYGFTAYTLTRKNMGGQSMLVAIQNFVTTGDKRGDQVQILSGIKEGDEVVTSGQIKLQNGSPVTVNNSIQPTNNPNPQPAER